MRGGNPSQTSKSDSGIGCLRTYCDRRHCATSTGRMEFAGKRFKVRPGRRRDPYKLRNEASLIFVEISDTGIGIEPQALSTVFDAFTQGSEEIARQFGGLGLGLAIRSDHRSSWGYFACRTRGSCKGNNLHSRAAVASSSRLQGSRKPITDMSVCTCDF